MNYAVDIKSWNDVGPIIKLKNPQVYKLIESGMTKSDKFMIATYPFGTNLLNANGFTLPLASGDVVNYNSTKLPKDYKSFFKDDIAVIPFGIIEQGAIEVFWETTKRTIPIGSLRSGDIVGTRTFRSEGFAYGFKQSWSISSGARTLMLLPSIKDNEKFKRLKSVYGLKSHPLASYKDQYNLFSEICKKINSDWSTKVIFFSHETLEKMRNSSEFTGFRQWLTQYIADVTYFERNQSSFNFIWEDFIDTLEEQGIKERTYIYNIAKHLIIIAMGEDFGFVPCDSDEFAPISSLTQVFVDAYKSHYIPNFLCAQKLNEITKSVYYSIQAPIHLDPYPEKETTLSDLDNVRSIKHTLERFFDYINSHKKTIKYDTIINNLPNTIKFEYFHTTQDRLKEISKSSMIIQDQRFTRLMAQSKDNLPFANGSTFFKGCIKISLI